VGEAEAAGTGPRPGGLTYQEAGVDIAAGEAAVEAIKAVAARTARPEVLAGIGGFGAMFALGRYRQPVLVASTDGVGTKALVAQSTGRLSSIGIDLVAMCCDDLVCQGAEPLFLLDYLAVGRLEPGAVKELVSGVAEGCRRAGCALIGGETAEHPDAMAPGQFDLAGFAVGVVERDRVIDGSAVREGDVLVGLSSPGLRCNGYSLARRALLEVAGRSLADPAYPGAAETLADALLEPSVIYTPAVLSLLGAVDVHALAHITGGGLAANLSRVLPSGLGATIDRSAWAVPPIFSEIGRAGGVAEEEMERVFNLGIGMVVIVPGAQADEARRALEDKVQVAGVIGEVVAGQEVALKGPGVGGRG
jgi:phosphoribosylformylglycinamidine cyclo-ligase